MYAVYDIKYYEQCVGIFLNRKELAKFFNTTPNSIGSSITRNEIREKRYEVKKINEKGI